MAAEDSFEEVLAQLRRLDDRAASKVFNRFALRLISLARQNLDPRILKKVDPEDVVQSVMKSVMLRIGKGQFILDNWDSIWGLLARVTIHKCRKWVDHFQAQRRQLDREGSDPSWEAIDREPTPSEGLMLAETLQEVLRGLTAAEKAIVTLSLEGAEVKDVSTRVGCSISKVYRVLKFVKKRLERMRDGCAAGSAGSPG